MDSLHVAASGGSSRPPSRSPSPCPTPKVSRTPLPSQPSATPNKHGNATPWRPGGGPAAVAAGGASGATAMSRRRSPLPVRRETQQAAGGDASSTHLGRSGAGEPLSAQGSEEDTTSTVVAAAAAAAGVGAPPPEEEETYFASSSILSNGSLEHVTGCGDEADGSTEGAKTRNAMERMQVKIACTKELIKSEQTARDDNVDEYLKLAANADKQQLPRIKAVFEKKNQKSAQSISQLQKKLDSYQKRLRDLEVNGAGSSHRQPREMLRDVSQGLKNVGGNIRDGITGFSGGVVENIKGGLHGAAETVMAKPREFAHLIKNKFGSADNINILTRNGESGGSEEDRTHHGSATLPGGCSLTSGGSGGGGGSAGGGGHTSHGTGIKLTSDEGSECSSVTSESLPHSGHPPSSHRHMSPSSVSLEAIVAELRERQDDIDRLRRKFDDTKDVLHREIVELTHSLQEERFRCERLEEQINDLTELHQNEVENLKQTITDMEEKVQYQSEERLRDIHDMLESCQTKISKMEHQQLQHQQYVTLEGIDNSNARALVVKLINIVLTVLQVVLLLVATAAGILMPFLRTRLRVLTTTILIGGVVFVLKQWPEVHDVGSHMIRRLKEALTLQ